MSRFRTIVVPLDLGGERADKVVATSLAVPRSVSRSLIDDGAVTIDGRPVAPSERLKAGTVLDVAEAPAVPEFVPDPSVPFDVVYEDDDLLIVDKPAGVTVHPTSVRSEGTLVHGLVARFPEIRGVGQEGRWGIVHRLDRETSGLLVVARTVDAYGALVSMMKRREISRRYLALVVGTFDNATGTIEAPIGRDPRHPTRMRVDNEGKEARTHYRRLASWDSSDRSLLSVTLDTGRTHQIRVHLAAIDHPIVGDVAYGQSHAGDFPGRPWLHARELAFVQPFTGAELTATSEIPPELSDSLAVLGVPATGAVADLDGSGP
jgi:23S rRNA pseudouridine1911/1915/1917 synthase